VRWQALSDALLHGTTTSGLADEGVAAAEAPSPLLHGTHGDAAAAATAATSQMHLTTEALHSQQQSLRLLELMLRDADCADRSGGVGCEGSSIKGHSTTARHLLQATGEQSLADVIAGLATELGTNLTSQPLTQQGVDLLTVRLSLSMPAWLVSAQ
jgi:hypothetical protein